MDRRFNSEKDPSFWYVTSVLFKELGKGKTILCPVSVQRGRDYGIDTVSLVAPAPRYSKEALANKCKVGWFFTTIEKHGTGMTVKPVSVYQEMPGVRPDVTLAFKALISEQTKNGVSRTVVELGDLSSAKIRKLFGVVHKKDIYPIMAYINNKGQFKSLWPWNAPVDSKYVNDVREMAPDMEWYVCHVPAGADGFVMMDEDSTKALAIEYKY